MHAVVDPVDDRNPHSRDKWQQHHFFVFQLGPDETPTNPLLAFTKARK